MQNRHARVAPARTSKSVSTAFPARVPRAVAHPSGLLPGNGHRLNGDAISLLLRNHAQAPIVRASLLSLQRRAGNRYVQRVVAGVSRRSQAVPHDATTVRRSVLSDVASAVLPAGLLDKVKSAADSVRSFAGTLADNGNQVAADGTRNTQQVGNDATTASQAVISQGGAEAQSDASMGQRDAGIAQQKAKSAAGTASAAAGWLGSFGPVAEAVLNPALPVLDTASLAGAAMHGVDVVRAIPGGLAEMGQNVVAGAKSAIDQGGGWTCDEAEIVGIASNVKKAVINSAVKAGKKLLGPERFAMVMAFAGRMRTAMQQVAAQVKATVGRAEATLKKWWNEGIGPWINKLEQLGTSLRAKLDQVEKKVAGVVDGVLKSAREKWDWIKSNVIDRIEGMISAATTAVEGKIKWVRDLVGSWWDKLPGWLKDTLGGAAAALAGPIGIAVGASAKAASYIVSHKDELLGAIKRSVDDALKNFARGYDFVKGLATAAAAEIRQVAAKVSEKIQQGVQAAFQRIDHATGGGLTKLLAAADSFGKKLKGEVCTALGEVGGPCVKQFVPSPGELAGKGAENFVELKANADLTVPVEGVPVKVARDAKIRISAEGEKDYKVEIEGAGSIGVAFSGEKEEGGFKLTSQLPGGASVEKSWSKLSGKNQPAKAPEPKAPEDATKGGAKASAEAGVEATVTMEYKFDASKKPDTTCGGLGGLTGLLAAEGLSATLPAPFDVLAGAVGRTAFADQLASCKAKFAQYGNASVDIKAGGAAALKATIAGERAVEVSSDLEAGTESVELSASLSGSGSAALFSGAVDLGALGATGEVSAKLTYSNKEKNIKDIEAQAKLTGSLDLKQAGMLEQILPGNAKSAVAQKLGPYAGPGASGNISVEAWVKATQLQKLLQSLDAYMATPDQVTSDGALSKIREHLASNHQTGMTVTLTASQTYGVAGEASAEGVTGGAGVSLERGAKRVLFETPGAGGE